MVQTIREVVVDLRLRELVIVSRYVVVAPVTIAFSVYRRHVRRHYLTFQPDMSVAARSLVQKELVTPILRWSHDRKQIWLVSLERL